MINRQFSSIYKYISFLHFNNFKIQFHGVHFALCSGLQNTHLHDTDDTINRYPFSTESLLTFLVYNMFCSLFDTNLSPIPWAIGLGEKAAFLRSTSYNSFLDIAFIAIYISFFSQLVSYC